MKTYLSTLSACLGNFFEHFDAALFGFLSPFLAPLIFPKEDPITALLLTYALFPLGMLARPLGALFFGKMGDRYGPTKALSLSLGYMGIVSIGMAFIPPYETIGIASMLLFCMGRIAQNFLSAGEAMGGAIFMLENSPKEKHDLLSSLYNATTVAGILLASFGVFFLCYCKKIEQGWRILYLFGAITALFGHLVRQYTPKMQMPQNPMHTSLRALISFRKPFLQIIVISGFAYANYSISLVFLNGFIPLVTSISKETMSAVNTALLVFDFSILPLCGYLASKMGRKKLMLTASFLMFISAPLIFVSLKGASLLAIIIMRSYLVTLGVAFFAPFHAFAKDLVPKEYRYRLISLGYAIGSQLIGGPTAALSLWMFQKTSSASSASWYVAFLALIATFIILKSIFDDRKSIVDLKQ